MKIIKTTTIGVVTFCLVLAIVWLKFELDRSNISWLENIRANMSFNNIIISETMRVNKKVSEALVVKDPSIKIIQENTVELIDYIEEVKETLVRRTGGVQVKTGEYVGVFNRSAVVEYMIGNKQLKDGKAYELQIKVDRFSDFLTDVSGEKFNKIALDGFDDPFFKNQKDYVAKDFANLHFGNANLIEALAFLTEIQLKIALYEERYLENYMLGLIPDIID